MDNVEKRSMDLGVKKLLEIAESEKDFEKFAKLHGLDRHFSNGRYWNGETQIAYLAWDASEKRMKKSTTTPTPPAEQIGTKQVQNDTKLNLSPAEQEDAINRAFQLLHNREFESEARALMDAVEAIKASGAEHLRGLLEQRDELLQEWLDVQGEDCNHFDHHGYCQSHFIQPKEDCLYKRTKEALSQLPEHVRHASNDRLTDNSVSLT